MSTIELTAKNLERTITENNIVLIDLWAAGAVPTASFAPVYEHASLDHLEMVFGKVDTETERSLAAAQITSIPTLMAFKYGSLVFSQPGALPATALEQVITAMRQLDIEQIHTHHDHPRSA